MFWFWIAGWSSTGIDTSPKESNPVRNRRHCHRGPWHYINWPFKPEGQPDSVQIRDPEPVNTLTAMTENESVVKNESDRERKAIALAWLFHLVGDIHQPLHTAQLQAEQTKSPGKAPRGGTRKVLIGS